MVTFSVGRLRKGAWTEDEDDRLRKCISVSGEGKWHQVPLRAGLNRCRKSCRLRWFNYLSPNIKRGEFTPDEIDLMIRLHKLLGNRWSLIAGRLPGRTSNDVKNYWNTRMRMHNHNHKQMKLHFSDNNNHGIAEMVKAVKPAPTRPRPQPKENNISSKPTSPAMQVPHKDDNMWWESSFLGNIQGVRESTGEPNKSLPVKEIARVADDTSVEHLCWSHLYFEDDFWNILDAF